MSPSQVVKSALSLRGYIIIHQLPEESNETYQSQERLVRSFVKDSLENINQ